MLSICRLMRQVRIEPIRATIAPVQSVRTISISAVLERGGKMEKKWTQRRSRRARWERFQIERKEEFEEKQQRQYTKSIARQKSHVDK